MAAIGERFEPPETPACLGDRPAVLIDGGQRARRRRAAGARRSRGAGRRRAARQPDAITADVVQDVTSIIRDRRVILVRNGMMGLVLVVAVMDLLSRPRVAIRTAISRPVAFA